jgi:hypothetical protein
MTPSHDILVRLAENRERRLGPTGRPVFALTDVEVENSTRTAMRLAEASKSQVEARSRRRLELTA